MVWWNAVSNTATIGVSGISPWQASIPIIFGGLWSGAKSIQSLIASITLSSIITELAKFSPPWTTLWPTAPISSIDFKAPWSGWTRAFNTNSKAFLWSDIGSSIITSSLPVASCFTLEPSIPILSTNPFASTPSFSIFINWYLSEELPQFITSIFILHSS